MSVHEPPYAHPPIVEALCQFNFASRGVWHPAIPGMIYTEVRKQYPAVPEQQAQAIAEFQVGPAGSPAAPNFQVDPANSRMLFRDQSGRKLLVISAGFLSVNSLSPYEGWDRLRLRAEQALSVVAPLTEVNKISGVNLRYINRIATPGNAAELDRYFDLNFRETRAARSHIEKILSQIEYRLEDEYDTRLAVTFATAVPDPSEIDAGDVFLLDLNVSREFSEPQEFSKALEHASQLRDIKNIEFEARIKDQTRELFQ